MYIGEMLEASPIARPPTMRHAMNVAKEKAQPVRTEETAKSAPASSRERLRPSLSPRTPERRDPARQPTSAQLLPHPMSVSVVRWKYASKKGLPPPMTTQSYPNKKPPSA